MKTIEQVEREHFDRLGRYDETTNSYEFDGFYDDPDQCDYCGYYFDEDEIENIDGENVCCHCKEKYLNDLEIMFDEGEILEINKVFEINKAS